MLTVNEEKFRLRIAGLMPWIVLSLIGIVCGCGAAAGDERGQRVADSGTVTLNGEPLEAGRIMFVSDQGDGVVRAAAMIQDGAFEFEDSHGPLIGQTRVEIRPVEMELEELEAALHDRPNTPIHLVKTYIPPQYNSQSNLTANVTDDPSDNIYDFTLVSR